MAPADGTRHLEHALDQVRPVAINKPQKQTLSVFELAAKQAREDVLRAIRECGTTNTDFLPERRFIGTNTLRPLAHLGESIIPEQPHPISQPELAENTPHKKRVSELHELQQWLANFPESLKF